jgi:hypothetical protein
MNIMRCWHETYILVHIQVAQAPPASTTWTIYANDVLKTSVVLARNLTASCAYSGTSWFQCVVKCNMNVST